MVDSARPGAKGTGVMATERHRKWNANWQIFKKKKKGKHKKKHIYLVKMLLDIMSRFFFFKEKNGLTLVENKSLKQNLEME